mmetsp:Transcript_47056/g.73641  ORF Transcript_47056/g.73641 Transcript_47056/m.73641 type:complete len:215 (+) Transcript_47056:146-790(+)
MDTSELIMRMADDNSLVIFYQSDKRIEGRWLDKSFLLNTAAERAGTSLLWHKIVCIAKPGTPSHGRPAYTHMMCFSRHLRDTESFAQPDVLANRGDMPWARAMGSTACELACTYITKLADWNMKAKETTDAEENLGLGSVSGFNPERKAKGTILDPFCGLGNALCVANRMGFNAIGVERNKKRAKFAALQLLDPAAGHKWLRGNRVQLDTDNSR